MGTGVLVGVAVGKVGTGVPVEVAAGGAGRDTVGVWVNTGQAVGEGRWVTPSRLAEAGLDGATEAVALISTTVGMAGAGLTNRLQEMPEKRRTRHTRKEARLKRNGNREGFIVMLQR